MNGLIVLIIALIVLTCLSFATSPQVILSPQLLFCVCFLPGAIYALGYVEQWEIDLDIRTLAVVIGGCVLFLWVSFAIGRIRRPVLQTGIETAGAKEKTPIVVERWKLIVFLAFQVVTLVWLVTAIMNLAGGEMSLSDAIYYYRDANLFTEDKLELPTLLREMRRVCMISGYLWTYLLLHNFFTRRKRTCILLICNILLCIGCSMMTGERTSTIQLIIAAIVQWYFLSGRMNGWKLRQNVKYIIFLCAALLAMVFVFQVFGNFLGRGSTRNFGEYIAIYLSAELKNLDTFIRNGQFGAPVEQWQTLVNVVNYIGENFNLPNLVHDLDIPMLYVNGNSLGNVCTVFYAFLYDGGYVAVILFTVVMAVLSQFAFRGAAYGKSKPIDMKIVLYSYMVFTIAFSFFSNKFYEMLFMPAFIRQLIYLFVIRWILLKPTREFCEQVREAGRKAIGKFRKIKAA